MIYTLLNFGGADFHCVIRGFSGNKEYEKIKEDLLNKYYSLPLTEVIRGMDEYFGKEYFTLKDLFLEERRKIISILIKDQLNKFTSTYKNLYEEGKGPIMQLHELGLQVPSEFKIAADYTLSRSFNDIIINSDDITNSDFIQEAIDIVREAKKIGIELDNKPAKEIYLNLVTEKVKDLEKNIDLDTCKEIIDIIVLTQKLNLKLDFIEAQNIYFNLIYNKIPVLFSSVKAIGNLKFNEEVFNVLLELGAKLNFNVDKYFNDLACLKN